MNVDNREYIFRVLNDVTKLPFLAEDWGQGKPSKGAVGFESVTRAPGSLERDYNDYSAFIWIHRDAHGLGSGETRVGVAGLCVGFVFQVVVEHADAPPHGPECLTISRFEVPGPIVGLDSFGRVLLI